MANLPQCILFVLLTCLYWHPIYAQENTIPSTSYKELLTQELESEEINSDTTSSNTPATPTNDAAFQEYLANLNPKDFTDKGVFQALDKVTTRISSLTLRTKKTTNFSNLEITLHSCWKSPPEEQPESKALVEVWEEIPGEPKVRRFYGWMFASSPALSALEHPVYDITLISCTN